MYLIRSIFDQIRKSKGTLLIAYKASTIMVQKKDDNIICPTKLKWNKKKKRKKSSEWFVNYFCVNF